MRDQGIEHVLRSTAWYCDGPRIGPVTAVFVDDDHGRPRWALVGPGRLIPLCRTVPVVDGRLLVVLPVGAVEDSPPLPPDAVELRAGLEDVLYAHYAHTIDHVRHPFGSAASGPSRGGPVTCRRAAVDDDLVHGIVLCRSAAEGAGRWTGSGSDAHGTGR